MRKINIMHIENSRPYLDVMERFFKRDEIFDYKYSHVTSCEKALDVMEELSSLPDILIVDLMLENDNDPKPGVEFINRLRANEKFKNLIVIVLTATTKASPKNELEEAGLVEGYYNKTFRPSKWKNEIKNIFEKVKGGSLDV